MCKSISSQRRWKVIRKRWSEKTVPIGFRAVNEQTNIEASQTVLPSSPYKKERGQENYARTVCSAAVFLPMLHTCSKGDQRLLLKMCLTAVLSKCEFSLREDLWVSSWNSHKELLEQSKACSTGRPRPATFQIRDKGGIAGSKQGSEALVRSLLYFWTLFLT